MTTRFIETSWLARLLVGAVVLAAIVGLGAVQAAPQRQEEPALLAYGETVEGALSADQPSVVYEFDADAGDEVTITMVAVTGELDPFIVLNDPDGNLVATDDNGGGDPTARLAATLAAAGRYSIQATQAGGDVPAEGGTFALNLTAAVGDEGLPLAESEDARAAGARLAKLEPGAHVEDVLTRQVAARFYWFLAPRAGRMAILPDLGGEFEPRLALYDARFNTLEHQQTTTGIEADLDAAGVYFLAVAVPDSASEGGTYAFTLELGSLPGMEGLFAPIGYGETREGTLDDTMPGVTYEFYGSAGDEVTVSMRRSDGDLDSYLSVLDAEGQLLYEDNDSGSENGDAQLTYTLPRDGRYLIIASRLRQAAGTTSGAYSLALTSDAAAPSTIAEPVLPAEFADFPIITYGESVAGEITSEQYLAVYVFLGDEGDNIIIDMISQNPTEANGLDPYLVLLDDERIPLIEDDDIVDGVERDARIAFTLPRRAFYAIVATRFDHGAGSTTGPYTLTLQSGANGAGTGNVSSVQTPVLDQLSPAPLAAGEPLQADLEGRPHVYSFRGVEDGVVDLSLTADTGVEALVIVADENLNEIASGVGETLNGVLLPKTGGYAVIVAPRFGPSAPAEGGYILALAQRGEVPVAAQAVDETPRALVYGDAVNGEISATVTSRTYTFEGTAGDRVRITMEATPGSGLDAYLELQDAAGVVVDANDDINPGVIRDAQIMAALPAEGRYTIVASRYSGEDISPTDGAYRLSLELVDEFTTAGVSSQVAPIRYGDTLYAEINDDQYLLFYVFDGAAGDVITVDVNNVSGNLDSVLHLFRSAGNAWLEVANNDDSPTGGTYEAMLSEITLPEDGKYLIAVSRFGLGRESSAGAFSLTLTRED